MRKLICILSSAFAMFSNSCTGNQCNKLEFIDSFVSVQHNIIFLDSLLRTSNIKCSAQYDIIFNKDSLLVKDRNSSENFNLKTFCPSAKIPTSELDKISDFMRRNYISFVVKRNGEYLYYFNQCNLNDDFNYIRYVIINKENVKAKISEPFKILDTRENLILVSPRSIPSYYHLN